MEHTVVDAPNMEQGGGYIAYRKWFESLGVSRVTAWKWRKLGMVKPVSVCGRLYISAEEIARFWSRAKQGEFPKASQRRVRREKPILPRSNF